MDSFLGGGAIFAKTTKSNYYETHSHTRVVGNADSSLHSPTHNSADQALQFGYEIADRNGEKSKTQHIVTQENLYAPNEINTYTVDCKSFRLEGEEVLDLSRLAEQNDIEEVWSQYLKFSKGHIIYLIDRAEMTKNTMTVRTNNTYWVLIDSFGPSPKNRKGGGK